MGIVSELTGGCRKYKKTAKQFLRMRRLDWYVCQLKVNNALSPIISGYVDAKKAVKKAHKATLTRYVGLKKRVTKVQKMTTTRYDVTVKKRVTKAKTVTVARYAAVKNRVTKAKTVTVARYAAVKSRVKKAHNMTVTRWVAAKSVFQRAHKKTNAKKLVKNAQSSGKKAKICPYVVSESYTSVSSCVQKVSPGSATVRRVEFVDNPQTGTVVHLYQEMEDPIYSMFSDDNPNACSIM